VGEANSGAVAEVAVEHHVVPVEDVVYVCDAGPAITAADIV